jgi:hypothetical protein
MKIRLITVVWGHEFVDFFLTVGLRSLLAEGNAQALARAHQVNYTIYTTPEDALRLEGYPAFIQLRGAVNVQLSLFNRTEIDPTDPGSHGILWSRGLRLAQRNGEVLFFIMPDVLHARGTLLRWANRFEAGAKALFTIGPRVALETALPELEARFPDRDSPCDLDQQQLIDLLHRHFHPLHAIMRRDSTRRHAHPEYDLRVVPGQGMIVREIVSHPFALDPGFFSKLRFFTPEDHLETLAFEPCSTVSLEPIAKFIDHWYRPWPLDQTCLSNLGGWWDWHSTKSCERESEHAFELCFHSDDEPAAVRARTRAIGSGRFYRSQIVVAGRLYRLFAELREHKLSRAATVLATAVFAGRLRRRLGVRRRAILLVPVDSALDEIWSEIRKLLAPGRERELVDIISNHVLLSKDEVRLSHRSRSAMAATVDVNALFTVKGLPAEPLIDGARFVAAPFEVGPFTIYPIDRVLWRPACQPAASSAATSLVSSTVVNSIHAAPDATRVVNPIHPAGRQLRPYLDRGRRALRQMLRSVGRRAFAPTTNLLRRIALKTERVPVVGKSVHLLVMVLGSVRQHGVATTWARIVERVPPLGALRRLAVRARRRPEGLADLIRRAVNVLRRDGPALVMRKVAVRLKVSALERLTKPRLAPRSRDIDTFNDVRRVRMLQAIEQVLTEFRQALQIDEEQSASLAFVREILDELETAKCLPVHQMLIDKLRKLTSEHPTWSDAWLELGFVHLDMEQRDHALVAFERAMQGTRLKGSDRANSLAIAAASHGRILAAGGRHREACDSFSYCLSLDPGQAIVAVEYAEQLRKLGQLDLATTYYVAGMYYRGERWNVPKFPRDARELSFPSLTPRKGIGLRPKVNVRVRSATESAMQIAE